MDSQAKAKRKLGLFVIVTLDATSGKRLRLPFNRLQEFLSKLDLGTFALSNSLTKFPKDQRHRNERD